MDAAVEISDLRYAYNTRCVLELPSMTLAAEGHAAIIGASGSGKSTLLHLLAGLLTVQQGDLRVFGRRTADLSVEERDRFRGRHLGILLQRLHLLPSLSVLDNLMLAQRLARVPADRAHVLQLLERVGLRGKAAAMPAELSQGQAQRVAITRAVVHRPSLILADEPTSSLDDDNAERVVQLLIEQACACGAALLVVTHDARIRGRLSQEVRLETVR